MSHMTYMYGTDWGMGKFPICSVWLLLFSPLVAAALITLFTGKRKGLSAALSIGAILISFALSLRLFLLFALKGVQHQPHAFEWLVIGNTVRIEFGMTTDALALLMLLVVTGVGSAIHIYSLGYMKGDPGFSRFFACMSLFTFSMLGIVISSNFIQIFIFWELVGVSSYLLIGFWFEKPSAAEAGNKAFLTTRIGDVGMMLGILLLWSHAHTFDFTELQAKLPTLGLSIGTLALIGALIFTGAVGKSAQVPLHVWLPDAMEGPTPVSALIHAATMVAAGVYMLCRVSWLILPSETALWLIAWIGGVTALMAATIAIAQNDIKRILAYSTLSQLGYMVMAVGLGRADAGDVSSHDARILQGAIVPRRGQRDHRAAPRTGHLEDGRAVEEDADHVLDIPDRYAGAGGCAAVERVLQQGRNTAAGLRTQLDAVYHGHRDGVPDRLLHGARGVRGVLRQTA